ncbi:hypothetical protein HYH68_16485 [Clostridium botulinum]|uniref:hypothetical protein n=1 Tax=Clostridium botulinum TaxID=1491 RepID=UPI001C9A4749|nr:hypothetical protein [Clostridium botulinum]MBY6889391.1 hypothetical protein [Clostridium botulinum]
MNKVLKKSEKEKRNIKNNGNIKGKDLKNMEILEQRVNKAFVTANNAIFFSDRSNYLKILYEVCRILNPSSSAQIGSFYIDN